MTSAASFNRVRVPHVDDLRKECDRAVIVTPPVIDSSREREPFAAWDE